MGNEIKFKPATFYLGIVDHLAKAVEGLKPEDMDSERSDQDAKRGHGEIRDGASQRVALVEMEHVTATVEESVMKLPPTKLPPSSEPSDKGKDGDVGPVLSSGSLGPTVSSNHNKATDARFPTILDVSTPTPSTSKEADSHSPPPQQQLRDSKSKDPRPIPTHEVLQ